MLTFMLKNNTTALTTDIEKMFLDSLDESSRKIVHVSSEDLCEYDGTIKIVIDIPGTDINISGKMSEIVDCAGVIDTKPDGAKPSGIRRKDVVAYIKENEPEWFGDCVTCTHFGQCMVCGECYSGSRYAFDWKHYLEENRAAIEASLKKSA